MKRLEALVDQLVDQTRKDKSGRDADVAELAGVRIGQRLGEIRVAAMLDVTDAVAAALVPKVAKAEPKKARKD